MKPRLPIGLKVFLCSFTWLFWGTASQVLATPMILNFQIEDPLGGQYDTAEFSYVLDKETPFWANIEGDSFGSQNHYKYHVEFYQADAVLGSLPDLVLSTTQTIGDAESGLTDFSSGSYTTGDYMEIYSSTSWYFWDFINYSTLPRSFEFISQELNLSPATHDWTHRPTVWLNSVEPAPEPIPEPSTALLLVSGFTILVRKMYTSKQNDS